MAIIERLNTPDEVEPEIATFEVDHGEWIEWYKQYIEDVRNGLHPEYRPRESFRI